MFKKPGNFGKNNGNYKHGMGSIGRVPCPFCGKPKSRPAAVCRECAIKQNKFSHKPTKEDIIKMSKAQKARDPETRYKIILTPEMIKKASKTRSENWKKLDETEKERRIDRLVRITKRKKDTLIEKIINKYLIMHEFTEEIDYKRNVYIGKYNVDFLVNDKYIIEAYGDYWHKNPEIYKNGNTKRKKDKIKKEYLESIGYYFCYFWESHIHNDHFNINRGVQHLFSAYFSYGSYLNIFEWEFELCK